MSLLDSSSHECAKSELDLFDVPPTQTSVENSFYRQFFPTTSLERGGPIEFQVKVPASSYLDLQQTILYLKCRIMKHNGDAIASVAATHADFPKTLVAPISYFHATLFKNVEVYLNSKPVNQTDNLYGYKAYLETLLSFSREAKTGQLQGAYFYQDEGEDLDVFVDNVSDRDSTENSGLTERLLGTQNSKPFETFGRIHSELFAQSKLIPGGLVELRLRFHRADPEFCLFAKTSTVKYSVVIDSAILMVRHCEIAPHVRESHQKLLQTMPLKYPVKRIECKYFTRAVGRSDLSEQNLVTGILPRRVIVGFVESEAFNSKLTKNPLNFQHFNVSTIILRRNGMPQPFEEIELDYEHSCYSQGYLSLFQGVGNLFTNDGFAITKQQYSHGYALYGFNVSSDAGSCGTLDLITEGKLSLEVKLSSASSKSITMLCYLEYDSIIEIDRLGNVLGTGNE